MQEKKLMSGIDAFWGLKKSLTNVYTFDYIKIKNFSSKDTFRQVKRE